MSFYSSKPDFAPADASNGNARSTFSHWLLRNHGLSYRAAVCAQRLRPQSQYFNAKVAASSPAAPSEEPLVGIVGGGFAGLYAGLILQSLGIRCEIMERSNRVGGRIYTWYSSDYSASDSERSGLYGEVGGMRIPQFSADMLPVQQLALAVNSVLARNGFKDQHVIWRKFYYDSPAQRLRYNNMNSFTTAAESALDSFNFGEAEGGDVPKIWVTKKVDARGQPYLPINKIIGQVTKPFIDAINGSFSDGFALMMQYDGHSMWSYLTTVFTLGDMQDFYDPAMGTKNAHLPFSVASYLETTGAGTGMFLVSFVEIVIQVYDWGGSKDPYHPADPGIFMLTVDGGMQRFADACRIVLNLEQGIQMEDGQLAQVQVGMLPAKPEGLYAYTAPNLTTDAKPPGVGTTSEPVRESVMSASEASPRVFLEHEVVAMNYDRDLFDGHGGMILGIKKVQTQGGRELLQRRYPYVISTLPNGAYLNGEFKDNLLNKISFAKARAIRECGFMPAFKAFLTFKTQFWAKLGHRQYGGIGAASTDRPNRQIIYPSFGYEATRGVLQIYCWAQDARRLGALSDSERVAECLKGIAYLYPDVDVNNEFSGYEDGRTTKTWYWDDRAGGGAFALFDPGQYQNIYPTLLTPEFDGCLNFAGECCSVHHGWIVGALDSAYNAVYHILQQIGAHDKIVQMEKTWGTFGPPDTSGDARTENILHYAYAYNEIDRKAASIPAGAAVSIYGDSQYEFKGVIPAFVADYSKVPQTMKNTVADLNVLQMLNKLWDDNVAQREKMRAANASSRILARATTETAIELLERIYYGDNFQTIPRPHFWLKDDDEFARQQLAGFMPNLLSKVTAKELKGLVDEARISDADGRLLSDVTYVANYRQYLNACTVIPIGYYLAKPIVFFSVTERHELMPAAIQLETAGKLFTPTMPNAANAWLLAKMQTNGAGQSLHDVGFHQLLTHQICAMVSISLFSEEVFNPTTPPVTNMAFQEHPVFRLLRPHVVKTIEFQRTVYNRDYDPTLRPFPATRTANGSPGVYNLGFVYDLIFSCGRMGNYQLQDRIYNGSGVDGFRFLEQAIPKDAARRGVRETSFSYPYVHDAMLWYEAIGNLVKGFVEVQYAGGDSAVASDIQLQRFFDKLIPAFNYIDGLQQASRFPEKVVTRDLLQEVLAMFIWQFSVQHTVVNDGAYNQAAFVPNASTLMFAPPVNKSSQYWTPEDVLACLPSQTMTYRELGNLTFMDVQINASVTGQGPYPRTTLGRGVLEPSIDVVQDTYGFVDPALRAVVDKFYQEARTVGDAIRLRQSKDIACYRERHLGATHIPDTVIFDLISPTNVMNTIQT